MVRSFFMTGFLALCAFYSGASHAAAPTGIFGAVEFKADSLNALPHWQNVLQKIAQEKPTFQACLTGKEKCLTQGMRAWHDVMQQAKGGTFSDKLKLVNRYVNSWPLRRDAEAWNQPDYWASPEEFIAKSGDSEDFAIFKYASLQWLGIKPENMRIVVVRDMLRNNTHTVLAVYRNDDILILDSLMDAVLSHENVLQYVPQFSVSNEARWAHVLPRQDLPEMNNKNKTP